MAASSATLDEEMSDAPPSASASATAANDSSPSFNYNTFLEIIWKCGVGVHEEEKAVASTTASISSTQYLSLLLSTFPDLAPTTLTRIIRHFIWSLYSSYQYVSPLLQPLSMTHDADMIFLERLIRRHGIDDAGVSTAAAEFDDPSLDSVQLILPFSLDSPVTTPAHDILLTWLRRLRHHSLRHKLANLPRNERKKWLEGIRQHTSSTSSPSLSDEALIQHGYYSSSPPELTLESRMRLNFILDEYQKSVDQRSTTNAIAASVNASPSSSHSPDSAPRVWTPTLLQRIADVLQLYGLPYASYATAASSSSFSFVSPIDLPALTSILQREIPHFTATNQELLDLIDHLSQDYVTMCVDRLTGAPRQNFVQSACATFASPSATASSCTPSSPYLLSPSSLKSLRQSFLFWHQLRVRILDLALHDFTDDAQLLEWTSQYSPGMLDANEEESQGEDSLTGLQSLSPDTITLRLTPRQPKSLPSWWQIGLHDLCLLRAVNKVGVHPDVLSREVNLGLTAAESDPDSKTAHWKAHSLWYEHSRTIIRQRMGVADDEEPTNALATITAIPSPSLQASSTPAATSSADANMPPAASSTSPSSAASSTSSREQLPPLTPLSPDHNDALLKRVMQLIPALAAISTDELMNRLLQSVQVTTSKTSVLSASPPVAAAASSQADVKMEVDDAAAIKEEKTNDTPAVASSTNSSSLTLPPFLLTSPAPQALSYYMHTLPGFQTQLHSAFYDLLHTRYLELNPQAAAVATGESSASQAKSSTLASPAAAARKETPENPLKLADAVYLHVAPSTVTTALERYTKEAMTSVRNRKRLVKPEDDIDDEDEEDDDTEEENESQLAYLDQILEQKRVRLTQVQQLYGTEKAEVVQMNGTDVKQQEHHHQRFDHAVALKLNQYGEVVTPQHISSGLVLLKLGRLTLPDSFPVHLLPTSPSSPAAPSLLPLLLTGYSSIVMHESYMQRDKLAYYLCEILPAHTTTATTNGQLHQKHDQLRFQVTASDDLGNTIRSESPQAAWETIARRILEQNRNDERADTTTDTSAVSPPIIDGLERFGLKDPLIRAAVALELRTTDISFRNRLASLLQSQDAVKQFTEQLPNVMYYLIESNDSASSSSTDFSFTLSVALHRTFSHHWLTFESLKRGLCAPPEPISAMNGIKQQEDDNMAAAVAAASSTPVSLQAQVSSYPTSAVASSSLLPTNYYPPHSYPMQQQQQQWSTIVDANAAAPGNNLTQQQVYFQRLAYMQQFGQPQQ